MEGTCPKCGKDPLTGKSSDELYEGGAYNVDVVTKIECGACGEDIFMKPFESISHDYADSEDEL